MITKLEPNRVHVHVRVELRTLLKEATTRYRIYMYIYRKARSASVLPLLIVVTS